MTVNLFVLPYNYPMLLPLLDELFKQHRLKPTNEWRAQFHNYLRTMPTYYAGNLFASKLKQVSTQYIIYRSSPTSPYSDGCR